MDTTFTKEDNMNNVNIIHIPYYYYSYSVRLSRVGHLFRFIKQPWPVGTRILLLNYKEQSSCRLFML